MSVTTSGSEAIQQLAKALGIGKNCTGFTVVCKPDNIVRLHVTYALMEEDAIKAVEVFNNYELKEKE